MDWPLERNGRDLFAREPPLRELLKLSAPSNLSARNMEDALVRVISKHSLYPMTGSSLCDHVLSVSLGVVLIFSMQSETSLWPPRMQ